MGELASGVGEAPEGKERGERERERRRGANEVMNLAGTRVARAAAPGVRAARGRRGSLQVVAATTPQFKSTKHHHRSRPKKTRASAPSRVLRRVRQGEVLGRVE